MKNTYFSYIFVNKLNQDVTEHIFNILKKDTKICKTCNKKINWNEERITNNNQKWHYLSKKYFYSFKNYIQQKSVRYFQN